MTGFQQLVTTTSFDCWCLSQSVQKANMWQFLSLVYSATGAGLWQHKITHVTWALQHTLAIHSIQGDSKYSSTAQIIAAIQRINIVSPKDVKFVQRRCRVALHVCHRQCYRTRVHSHYLLVFTQRTLEWLAHVDVLQ